MSIEQTTQLIQLISNSLLMVIACGLVLGRLWMRHAALEEQLRSANHQCADRLSVSGGSDRLLSAKKMLRQLQRRYTVVHFSLLAAHYALLFAVGSTFALALRMLVNLEWLISIALALFVVGMTTLLLAIGFTLVDLHHSDRSLWDEITGILHPTKVAVGDKLDWRWQRSSVADQVNRGIARAKPSRARVS